MCVCVCSGGGYVSRGKHVCYDGEVCVLRGKVCVCVMGGGVCSEGKGVCVGVCVCVCVCVCVRVCVIRGKCVF